MTDPKPRVQLALELAALAWHGDEANALAKSIMAGGIHNIAIALANVLLHLVDEQATVHPIEGGQVSPPCHHHRLTKECRECAEPLTTMPRDYDHGLAPRSEGPELTPCSSCGAPHQPNDGIGGDRCGTCLELVRIIRELTETRAELTRIKVDNESLKEEVSSLKTDLSWEKGWDLCRKAQMGAVVEAARVALVDCDEAASDDMLACALLPLRKALSALDALSQPEGATSSRSEPR